MIHIDIHIPFYNFNGDEQRTLLTVKIFKHYKNIRKKFIKRANITFTLVGSEGDISKKLALNYFEENEFEYLEFYQDDPKYLKFFDMFNEKIKNGIQFSRNKNPDILLTSSSNDYICFDFFDQIIEFYNPSIPQIYGIDNYQNGKNGIYILPYDSVENKIYDKKSLWWNGVSNHARRGNLKYCGGIIGINKFVYLKNPEIINCWDSDEGKTEKNAGKIKNLKKFFSEEVFFINFKTINNNEITTMDKINKLDLGRLNFKKDFSKKMRDKISKELSYFLEL